jgi:adhesin/invasin
MLTQTRRCGARRRGSSSALLTVLTLLSLAVACDKLPLLAPAGTVITVLSSATSVAANGEVEIVATVIENGTTATPPSNGNGTPTTSPGAGTPVQNGTLVSFTTTIGRIDPREARTHNGEVRVKFIADGQSGTATITAYSGGASGKLENLLVGSAAAERVILSAQNLGPNGGSTTVSARVENVAGSALAGVPVTFSTTAGTVNPTSSITDSGGVATTVLTSTAQAQVTAAAGSKTGQITVALGTRLIASVTANPQAASVGTPITFTVTSGTNANIANATISFGDGDSRQLGSFSGTTTASHAYSEPGSYSVSVTATDATGSTQSQGTSVTIGSLPVTLTANPANPTRGASVTFTVGGLGTAQVARYEFTFSDGVVLTSSGPQTTRAFDAVGSYTARVNVIGLGGDAIATASIAITVTAPAGGGT